jgi:hypothetical protein
LLRERIRSNIGLSNTPQKKEAQEDSPKRASTTDNSTIIDLASVNDTQSPSPETSQLVETSLSLVQDSTLSIADIRRHLGWMIPLTCGHNGNLSAEETSVFDRHLQAVGYIK